VSLRGAENNVFLPEHPLTFRGEAPDPVDHAGRRYVFTHTVEGGYAGGATIYVFSAR
jgi:hypothetical protein